MNRFILAEPQNCIGCRTCEVACAQAHPVGNGSEALTPENFRPRLRVIKGARVSTPVICHQCDDAPCANACPSNAIVYREHSVQVLQERCLGCKSCMVACPYGVMEVVTDPIPLQKDHVVNSRQKKAHALKCDLCIDLPSGPACIPSCPTKALHLVDEARLEAAMQKRRQQAALETPTLPL